MRLTFGKHKGEDLADVPISYVKWLEEQDWVSDAMREECQWLIARAEGDRPGMGREVRRGPKSSLDTPDL